MDIDGFGAAIRFDPGHSTFRGIFAGLNGCADFHAQSVEGLLEEGRLALRKFLKRCAEEGIEPRKSFSGKFVVRVPPRLHERLTHAALTAGVSLNQWIVDALSRSCEWRDGLMPSRAHRRG